MKQKKPTNYKLLFIIVSIISIVLYIGLFLLANQMAELRQNTVSNDFGSMLSDRVCEDNSLGEHIQTEKFEGGFMIVRCLKGDIRFKKIDGR